MDTFLIDCFRDLPFCKYYKKIASVCKEWEELFLLCHPKNEKVRIGTSLKITNIPEGQVWGRLDVKSGTCAATTATWGNRSVELLVVYKICEGRSFLLVSSTDLLFVIFDAETMNSITTSPHNVVQNRVTNYPEFGVGEETAVLMRENDELVLYKSRTRLLDNTYYKPYIFDDVIVPVSFEHLYSCHNNTSNPKPRWVGEITPGDKILWKLEVWTVKMVIPPPKELKKLPTWYIPQSFRIPNSVVATLKRGVGKIKTILQEHVLAVLKSNPISSYYNQKEYLLTGMFLVLYVEDYLLGVITELHEEYYTLYHENTSSYYSLRYDEPIYQAFCCKQDAERWREEKIQERKGWYKIISPGDLIMPSFENTFTPNKLKHGFQFVNQVQKWPVEFSTTNQPDNRPSSYRKIYHTNTSTIIMENILDVIVATSHERVTLYGSINLKGQTLHVGSIIDCKLGKTIYNLVMLQRILNGGVVFNDQFFQKEKIVILTIYKQEGLVIQNGGGFATIVEPPLLRTCNSKWWRICYDC